jgi:putative hydrolase of the HAD superfamily
VPSLVAVIREHTPTLGLPAESRRVLGSLRAGWKVGLLTNGTPAVQRRKVEALGLGDLVDAVLCAVDVGDGTGKPAASAFYAALERLGATPASAVFVGDDPEADLAGASAIGMKTIHVVAHRPGDGACSAAGCGIHVRSLALVPAMASQLVPVGIGECL